MPNEAPGADKLPLKDNGVSPQDVERPKRISGAGRLIVIPMTFLLIFLGGILGLYFQPPGLQFAFRSLGLAPGGGTDTPMAVAIEQVSTREEVAVVSEGDVVALGRIIPRGDVILLHGCCHNPTGIDPTPEQWAKIGDILADQIAVSGNPQTSVEAARIFLCDRAIVAKKPGHDDLAQRFSAALAIFKQTRQYQLIMNHHGIQ